MRRVVIHRSVLALLAVGGLSVATLATQTIGRAASLTFDTTTVGPFGGEPYISSDPTGILYDTSPSGPETFKSLDKGETWTAIESGDTTSGDDCINEDQSGAAYWCNLDGTPGVAPLQAAVYKSTIANTPACTAATGSCQWVQGVATIEGAGTNNECATSCSPFGVDRQWTAANIPPGGTTSNAEVVLMYHDFYGPSSIWVNISHDGGATFSQPINVLASLSPASPAGSLEAEGYTFCNSVPAGVEIAPNGTPHAGRIYVAWIASDPVQDATGCNVSMLQSFHTVWVSWSDDGGGTWTTQQAIDMGIGHDTSTPFTQFTIDDQGNPYVAFDSQSQAQNPATCAAESTAGTEESDTSCGYNMYVVESLDGGTTWDGGGGTIPGSAAAPYQVNTDTGTDQFATIAVGDPGHVDVSWLHTSEIEPTDAFGKFDPGGCAGPVTGNPTTYPPTCSWNLFASQSTDLATTGVTPSNAQWTTTQVTSTPMHIGDICNLGIACVSPNSNRHLLDFNTETIDPTTGCAHIAYADDSATTASDQHLMAANQTAECDAFAGSPVSTPETPLTVLLIPAAALTAFGGWRLRRHRLRSASIG